MNKRHVSIIRYSRVMTIGNRRIQLGLNYGEFEREKGGWEPQSTVWEGFVLMFEFNVATISINHFSYKNQIKEQFLNLESMSESTYNLQNLKTLC